MRGNYWLCNFGGLAMKVCQLGLLVVALAVASQAVAADGQPSDATLAAMGLSDLRVMTDSEGLAVRGMGFGGAWAYGQSFAAVSTKFGSAASKNGYSAEGKYKAGGENYSFAGVEVKQGGNHGGGDYGHSSQGGGCNSCGGHGGSKPQSFSINAFAGGSSIGYRK
jgi:hypothetical protein